MKAKRQIGLKTILAAAALVASVQAGFGQFPTFKGDNARTGKNSSPATQMPGAGNLRWWHPDTTDNPGAGMTVDNTDGLTGTATSGGAATLDDTTQAWTADQWVGHIVYIKGGTGAGEQGLITTNTATSLTVATAWATVPDATSQYVIFSTTFGGTWTVPPVDQEAAAAYIPTGATTMPPYEYATSVASDATVALPAGIGTTGVNLLDPRVPSGGSAPSTVVATYTILPSDGLPRNYALYASVPVGPTGNTTSGYAYSQTHYVYEIDSANGQVFVDVVDMSLVGSGFFRLGGGGLPTNAMFSFDGVHPIVIKVYNTIPRDAYGNLYDQTLTGPPASPVVYADAVAAVPAYGAAVASPTVYSWGGGTAQTRTVVATNVNSTVINNGQQQAAQQGVVDSYDYQTGQRYWRWSPPGASLGEIMDNQNAGVTATFPFASDTTASNYYGIDYFSAPITNTLASSVFVGYEPVFQDGAYDIYIWLAGDSGGENFGKHVQIEVDEGAAASYFTVDESVAAGWVRIGARKFIHDDALGNDLTVKIYNYSADAGDSGKLAYADAVWFVGSGTGLINSTPVQANVDINTTYMGGLTNLPVTVVCGEDGRIYCLDAVGNGDGTTNTIWTYPSYVPANVADWAGATTYAIGDFVKGSDKVLYRSLQNANTGHNPVPGPDNVWWELADPNQVTGADGPGGIAQMPTGFDMSSALIQQVGGQYRLYVAASNGRIYCIDMTGRGDFNAVNKVPGTTSRVWSYPDDYPATPTPSTLGGFKGSLAFATITAGDTIFAGTTTGRMYALDAVGNVNHTTTPRWMYPATTAQNLGQITTTPAIDFGKVFFGTAMSNDGTQPGAFYALDQDTGNVVWTVNHTTEPLSPPGVTVPFDNFLGGPTTVSGTELGLGMSDTVFASNENRYVMAFDAATGAIDWQTNELGSGVQGALTYTPMTVYDNVGTPNTYPILLVPTEDGRVDGLFANTANLNRRGTRRAYEYQTAGGMSASVAVGLSWMYAADLSGYVYAFNDGTGTLSPGSPPGGGTIIENNPEGDTFANTRIKFITKDAYEKLRANPSLLTGAALEAGGAGIDYAPGPPYGFEYGETIYAIAYFYPYLTLDSHGNSVAPPVVNFSLSVEGMTLRQLSAPSYLFPDKAANSDPDGGYALLSFPIQGSGANALPPGGGRFQITLSSAALSGTGISQTFALDPALSIQTFNILNPLGISIPPPSGGSSQVLGDTNPANTDNQVNGTPRPNFISSTGEIAHGQNAVTGVDVLDRSLMFLMSGPGMGLPNVRVSRNDLAWNKAFRDPNNPASLVAKQLPGFATNMEDLPTEYPNFSLDYPDIRRSQIKVTKDPLGNAENPLFNGVMLNSGTPLAGFDTDHSQRTLGDTPFSFEVDVPRFQPFNNATTVDSGGNTDATGYNGSMVVFVDRNGTGVFDITNPQRSAYRTFTLGGSVSEDERISVGTPIVDLGALSVGTGFTPAAPPPWGAGTYSPYVSPFSGVFKPFVVKNEGNVNDLDLRIAHGTNQAGTVTPLAILSQTNDVLGWLDAELNVHSDIDDVFYNAAPIGLGQVILQKARVGDNAPSELSVNPMVRQNANLGVATNQPLIPGGPPIGPPHISATIPFGFPTGTYSQVIHVIEDTTTPDQQLDLNAANVPLESTSDPSFTLTFKVKEGQLTNSWDTLGAPMVDSLIPPGTTPAFQYRNVQPAGVRDLNGNLVVAWASDRGSFVPVPPTPSAAVLNGTYRLYVGSVQGQAPGALGSPTAAPGVSPLRDLNAFQPDGGGAQWFQQQAVSPYPNGAVDQLFNGVNPGGYAIDPASIQFHSPALPSDGFVNPLDPTTNFESQGITLAFVGDTQIPTPNGRVSKSLLFATTMTVDATGGVTLPAPIPLIDGADTSSSKGKPAVVQLPGQAMIFYPSAGTGESVLNYVLFDNASSTFGAPTQVPIPNSFESVGSVGAVARTGNVGAGNVVDLTFGGKLRGRQVSEIFFGSMSLDNGNMRYLDTQNLEPLAKENEPGLFRARGVGWNPNVPLDLEYVFNGVSHPLLTGTPTIDPTTGLMSYDTVLGKVYLDPAMGTVRFATGLPHPAAVLELTYQPEFLRISSGTTAAYSAPTLLLDDRFVSDLSFWARPDGTAAQPGDQIRPSRYIATYGRSAAGAGQAARPFSTTLRFGIDLPTGIATNPADGTVVGLSVSGNTSYFQVDPAQGKLYFTAADEGAAVSVAYTGVDNAGNPVSIPAATYTVGLIGERPETAVPIDLAVNEGNATTFVDPFGFDVPLVRPDLYWMIWASTRKGGADLFFQTLAPRFTPIVGGK